MEEEINVGSTLREKWVPIYCRDEIRAEEQLWAWQKAILVKSRGRSETFPRPPGPGTVPGLWQTCDKDPPSECHSFHPDRQL